MSVRESTQKSSERLYESLLLLYPRAFRLRFGSEMVEVFRDIYLRGPRNGGLGERLTFWLWTVGDLLLPLPRVWEQALVRPETIATLPQALADSLAVPVWVTAILLMEGYTWAALTQGLQHMVPSAAVSPNAVLGGAQLCIVAAIATCFLGTVSALASWMIVRHSRTERNVINMQSICRSGLDWNGRAKPDRVNL
jgi:hypothetical protein